MKIANKKGATGASSSAQSTAANLDSVQTVEGLCAVLTKEDCHLGVMSLLQKEQQSPLQHIISTMENGSHLDFPHSVPPDHPERICLCRC